MDAVRWLLGTSVGFLAAVVVGMWLEETVAQPGLRLVLGVVLLTGVFMTVTAVVVAVLERARRRLPPT
jgi:xanthine/uracil permease